MDWGLEKDLLLPYNEQTLKVHKGRDYLVNLYTDKSDRLCATMKIYPLLKVGSTPTGVPFTFLDTKTNSIQGIMVDIITEVGKRAGFGVQIEPMQFSTLIAGLTANKIDIIAAAMYITPARKEQVETLTTGLSASARALIETFWPGPLTMIFQKTKLVPKETTGGLNTVAVATGLGWICRSKADCK